MKKLFSILMAVLLVCSFAACDSNSATDPADNEQTALEGTLESIIEKIYDTADVSNTFKQFIDDGLQNIQVTPENVGYHLGKADIEFEEALASEPIMSSSAYSLVLLRAKEGADIEKLKLDIKENVDPMKWVCVGVEEENIVVDSIGEIIILIMSNEESEPLHDAFLALKD